VLGNAPDALVMVAAACGGLTALFEILKPIALAHLVNRLANNSTIVSWRLTRANQQCDRHATAATTEAIAREVPTRQRRPATRHRYPHPGLAPAGQTALGLEAP
jgi:hypothetical protein